jgi:hypothetical protein
MPTIAELLKPESLDVLRHIDTVELCEICEDQEKTGGKYCDDCRDDFKTSEDDK